MASSKRKKRLKFIGIFSSVAVIGPALWLMYFLVANDAPILIGEVIYNVEYKKGQLLDVYQPTMALDKPAPVVLYIHGGAWIGGSKTSININRYNGAVKALRDEGVAFVSMDYTLAEDGHSPFPGCIEDANDALKWIHAHADSLNFDPGRIGVFGESAGAHIAMTMVFNETNASTDPPSRYIISVYGPNRLEGIYHSELADSLQHFIARFPEGIRSRLDLAQNIMGFDPATDSARTVAFLEQYSPYNQLTPSCPPALIIHGTKDQIVPVDQSTMLQAKMDSLGVSNKMYLLPGMDHGFVDVTDAQRDSVQQWIINFVLENNKGHRSAL